MTVVGEPSTGTRGEWLRLHVARAVAWPFWRVSDLGWWADRVGRRVLWWGERARTARGEGMPSTARHIGTEECRSLAAMFGARHTHENCLDPQEETHG